MATAKVETLKAIEIDALTGEEIIRDLTEEEIADIETIAAQTAAQLTAQEAKATARASALAKLAELGLTEEEIQAL